MTSFDQTMYSLFVTNGPITFWVIVGLIVLKIGGMLR